MCGIEVFEIMARNNASDYESESDTDDDESDESDNDDNKKSKQKKGKKHKLQACRSGREFISGKVCPEPF